MSTSVALVDDHALVRAGFCALLHNRPGITIAGEAGNGAEAMELICKATPDIVLMDITLPGPNGLEITARVAREFPIVKVIILSIHMNEGYVIEALRSGARGYVLKDAAPEELVLAIQMVSRGEVYLCSAISRQMLSTYTRKLGKGLEGERPSPSWGCLTLRQREILKLIAEGLSTKDIADRLKISVKTVETHRIQLMDRLDIHDIAGLVKYAIRTGLIKADI